ncbi:MAG: hypothetical protein JKY16_04995 [Lutibacter sp.]|nr:hypothetical protein [Lutibacter sp.]
MKSNHTYTYTVSSCFISKFDCSIQYKVPRVVVTNRNNTPQFSPLLHHITAIAKIVYSIIFPLRKQFLGRKKVIFQLVEIENQFILTKNTYQ